MMKKKTATLFVAAALALGCAVGGTVAWLTAQTDDVVNTFTTSDINITLTEQAGGDAKEFKMIPGFQIAKDPLVTVKGGSEKCWLFVEVEESANFATFMEYGIADGWTAGDGTAIPANVYYRAVDAADADQAFYVLAGGTGDFANGFVAVKGTVTKADMEAAGTTAPTLTFTAYASQYEKNNTEAFTAAEAWANIA